MRNTLPPLSVLCGPSSEKLIRGQVAQRLVRPDVVVDLFPGPEQRVMRGELLGDLHEVVELLSMCPVGAFDLTIQLGTARRQDEEVNPQRLARGLEGRFELRAAIDLDRLDREAEPGKGLPQHALGG